jgi:hypothetical protein
LVVSNLKKVRACSNCGTPRAISKEERWQDNGIISVFRPGTPALRDIFYEVSGFNDLIENIEGVIGRSMDHIVLEARRNEVLPYLQDYFSGITGLAVRVAGRRLVYKTVAGLGAVYGFGHFEVKDIKRGHSVSVYGENVYNTNMLAGDLAATFNAVERLPASISVEENGNGVLCTISIGTEPGKELTSRFVEEFVPPKPGSVQFDRCPECGVPMYLKNVRFDKEKGSITDTVTGRRMIFITMSNIEALLRELQLELGEEITSTILRAQKDYTRNTVKVEEIEEGYLSVRQFFGIRGMGNLVKYELDGNRLEAKVENARPNLLVVGLLHGMFEIVTGKNSQVEYSLEDDGTVTVLVEAD